MSPKPTGHVLKTKSGADLVIQRTFRASLEDVWESVTAPESTARWIGPWSGEPGPGKTVQLQLSFEQGAPSSQVLIRICEPPTRLVVSTKDDYGEWHLELTLASRDSLTELTFVQHLTDPKLAGDVGPGWEYYLDMLVAARSNQPLPAFSDYYPAQRDHYLEQAKQS